MIPPGRLVQRRVAALAGTVGCACALAVLPAPGAAAPAPAAQSLPVEVVIERLTPQIPTRDDTLVLSGRIVNNSAAAVESPTVGLRISPDPLVTRDAVAVAADPEGSHTGNAVDGTARKLPTLAPGKSAPWTISVPVAQLGLGGHGVYPINVRVESGVVQVGLVKTFLPWFPASAQVEPTKLVMVWPLVDRPRTGVDGALLDDGLAADFAPGGRLNRLVEAGASARVTWVVEPDLIGTARTMAGGYQVAAGAERRAGKGSTVAKQWLGRLATATANSDVLALPFADPDVVALQHNGLAPHIGTSAGYDDGRTGQALGRAVRTDVAWPAGNQADTRTLNTLRRAGTTAVILDDSVVPLAEELTYTPTGRATLPVDRGQLTGLLADSAITRLLASDMSRPGAPVLAGQRFLAETAMITEERPGDPRVILVTPPRRWNPDRRLVDALIAGLRDAPWLTPATLGALERTPPPAGVKREALVYPDSARREELAATYLGRVRTLTRQLTRYQSILTDREQSELRYRPAILRAESSGWRHAGAPAFRYERSVRADLERLQRQVRILVSRRTVTLSSKVGKIPITVVNESTQTVNVRLRMQSAVSRRLSVEPVQQRRIGPQHTITFEVPAHAVANGIVDVTAQLETESGQPYGERLTLRVRATNYGTVGLYVIGSAVGLLFVIVAVRLYRRIRSATRVGEVRRTTEKVGA